MSARTNSLRRLSTFKAQESYYELIVERCLRLRHSSVPANTPLEISFGAMKLHEEAHSVDPRFTFRREAEQKALRAISLNDSGQSKEVSVIMQAIRKLREAIVATNRTDAFARDAYIFMLHAAILIRHPESYHPALLHLMRRIHPLSPLDDEQYGQVLSYYILDLACRQERLDLALELSFWRDKINPSVSLLVRALAHENWVRFGQLKKGLDVFSSQLADSASHKLHLHAMRCIQKTYLKVDKAFVERSMMTSWAQLEPTYNIKWAISEGDILKTR